MSHPVQRVPRIVLDTSAIAAFVAGVVAVGELLCEIDAEGGGALIPYPCLIEAAAAIPADGAPWLGILLSHPATTVVYEDREGWPMVAAVRAMLGSYELAAAAWPAILADVDVLTRHPRLYAPLGEDFTLPFDDQD